MIELGDGAAIDGDGLEFEPCSDLFFLLVGPGAEHLFEQWARLGGDERLGHGGILAEKLAQGNVWRLVKRRGEGKVTGCVFFFWETLWRSTVERLCGTECRA